MDTFYERSKQRAFVRKLETVSSNLSVWAQEKFTDGWSLKDVKLHIKAVARLIEKDS